MVVEQTLVLLKPDTVQRNLIGKIITRFEDAGLKIAAMKMVWADENMAKKHYHLDETWAKNVFDKTKAGYDKEGKKMPYKDHLELGKTIQSWNMDLLRSGPIIALVFEGPHAVEVTRKMVGSTEPRQAAPGTIRGDFATLESYALADVKKRVLRNLIHASDTPDNAKREISLWFSPAEVHNYKKDLDKHF
ncbi:MAG TPA: nucleoside-diphosphate kinase [Candidatus Nanoarchaeia archaeon]|nr:nucleoside-diphosphate kinase [Candidatus Nanoarchaeia archaeon]